MNYWLVKSEPHKYAWDLFEKEGQTYWDGVRNYQARNNLKAMTIDDLVLFYHSNVGLEIVGIAKVSSSAYQDPTTTDPNWVVVDLVPYKKLDQPVTLKQIKATPELNNIALIKQSRLSVMPITPEEYAIILNFSQQASES
jgi:predicted RNA-binding protein with PUA-like domain